MGRLPQGVRSPLNLFKIVVVDEQIVEAEEIARSEGQVHQASGFGGLNFVKTPSFMHYN
jgi:hypothetical protein